MNEQLHSKCLILILNCAVYVRWYDTTSYALMVDTHSQFWSQALFENCFVSLCYAMLWAPHRQVLGA